jgi:ribosomal protein L11 methyltransferase
MSNTIQITIHVNNENLRDELIAELSVLNYDAFEEKENELAAFIKEESFVAEALENILKNHKINYTKSLIEDQNWNALWESNFQPVIVDDFCAIRAAFHKPFEDTEHEIIITPKMSFGTGHHATTFMMISQMRHIDFKDKQVADFGTGTGVLSILAEKLGSNSVWAIDNDEWSIDNAKENIEVNGCKNIIIEKADGFKPKQKFDIILANINRNIILENMKTLLGGLDDTGKLLLSGLLKNDEAEVTAAFMQTGFQHNFTIERNGWVCILLDKDNTHVSMHI